MAGEADLLLASLVERVWAEDLVAEEELESGFDRSQVSRSQSDGQLITA